MARQGGSPATAAFTSLSPRDCVTATSGNLSSFLAALLASLPSADRIELTVAREDEKVARARSASDNTCLGCP